MSITLKDDILSVSILPIFKDTSVNNMAPITMTGTAIELDAEAWDALQTLEMPIKRLSILNRDIAAQFESKEQEALSKLKQNKNSKEEKHSTHNNAPQLPLFA